MYIKDLKHLYSKFELMEKVVKTLNKNSDTRTFRKLQILFRSITEAKMKGGKLVVHYISNRSKKLK